MYTLLTLLLTTFVSTIVFAQDCPGGLCKRQKPRVKNSCIMESLQYSMSGRSTIAAAQEKLEISPNPVGRFYSDYCRRMIIDNGEGERQFLFCGEQGLQEAEDLNRPGTNSILIRRNTLVIKSNTPQIVGDDYGIYTQRGDIFMSSCPEDSAVREQEYAAALSSQLGSIQRTSAIEITNAMNGALGGGLDCATEVSP